MKIFDLENIIIDILNRNKMARSDDHMLYIEVCSEINPECLNDFIKAFKNRFEYGLPSFESVSRARRKIQEKYPEFKENRSSKAREMKELEYIDYSINNKNFNA